MSDRPRTRSIRRLASGLFWTSLTTLFVASSLLWAASYWRNVNYHHLPTNRRRVLIMMNAPGDFTRTDLGPSTVPISVKSNRGQITIVRYSLNAIGPTPELTLPGLSVTHSTWRVQGTGSIKGGQGTSVGVRIAYPLIVVPIGAACAIRLVTWIRRRRRAARDGRCPACGYDLRATPGRCPECGTLMMAETPPSEPAAAVSRGRLSASPENADLGAGPK